MKKLLCRLTNKLATAYGGMTANASSWWFLGQTKTPSCLIKKD